MDPQYLQWLEIHHPESVLADKDNLITAPKSTEDMNQQSLADAFSFVSPTTLVIMSETEPLTGDSHTLSLTSHAIHSLEPPPSLHLDHTHTLTLTLLTQLLPPAHQD